MIDLMGSLICGGLITIWIKSLLPAHVPSTIEETDLIEESVLVKQNGKFEIVV